MNYYTFHSGDYLRDTSHLSLIEDAIYRRCLDWYYTNESPLPNDFKKIARLIRASDFLADVEQVVSEFFILGENGWTQSRCDVEIGIYHEKAQKARENGQKGGRPKTKTKPNHNQQITESVILANQTLTESKANQEPITNNQEPRTNISNNASALKDSLLSMFDCFWQQYPNKTAKQSALKAWLKLKPDDATYQKIMISVSKQKLWQQWQDGYIPHPATWLNGKRWEDIEPVRKNNGGSSGDMAQYIREASDRLRKQDEHLNVCDDSFLLIGGDDE